MNWLGIHEWIWILIFCAIGCIIFNPILYFIKWEIYERKNWIERKKTDVYDKRFFKKDEDNINSYIQIDEIRPQLKDVCEDNDDHFYWWFPGFSYFVFLYLFLYLIFKPTAAFWKRIVKWFGNIKV